jgi:hypothetical protein
MGTTNNTTALNDLMTKCAIPSAACDKLVNAYCLANKNDTDFCGCSTNAIKGIPDPAFGNLPIKCWATTCTQNPNAYQFFAYQVDQCPNVCVDNSSITALGSNITDSTFTQAGCGADVKTDGTAQKTLADLYEKGFLVAFGFTGLLVLILISISVLSSISL